MTGDETRRARRAQCDADQKVVVLTRQKANKIKRLVT